MTLVMVKCIFQLYIFINHSFKLAYHITRKNRNASEEKNKLEIKDLPYLNPMYNISQNLKPN